jgi:hypothetical protein|tara:strand:- start:5305 stop:5724 length:420 start_codon:yes stop_codon:yes gene_type:complete
MASKQYDSIQTRNKYGTFIGFDANHSGSILIPVNDKFKRTSVGIPNGSGTEISDFAITAGGLTSFIKLNKFIINSEGVQVFWGGSSDQIIHGPVTGQASVYGQNGEPPISDLPAGFTGVCKVTSTNSNGSIYLEFTAAN